MFHQTDETRAGCVDLIAAEDLKPFAGGRNLTLIEGVTCSIKGAFDESPGVLRMAHRRRSSMPKMKVGFG